MPFKYKNGKIFKVSFFLLRTYLQESCPFRNVRNSIPFLNRVVLKGWGGRLSTNGIS